MLTAERKLTKEQKRLYGIIEKARAKLPRSIDIITLVPIGDDKWEVLKQIAEGELPPIDDIEWFVKLTDLYQDGIV